MNHILVFLTPPQDRAHAEIARLERSLIVPEFADHTPLDLFDRDRVLVKAAPCWSWESARVTAIPRLVTLSILMVFIFLVWKM